MSSNSSKLAFDGRVAIVTGAGAGLGRSHALLLASRGAKVVVNDLGGSAHGAGQSSAAADAVVAEIKHAGGEAVANYDSVEDGAKIVQCALDAFGKVDIVVNNAGILRDTTFQKMTEADWEIIYRVHVLGSFRVTHAAWGHMRDREYGRIVFTASAAGLYGNFGQTNYSMAKLGVLGLANTLAIEGRKKNILVNTIAPIAGSRLTETVMPKELTDQLKPEYVSPLVVALAHESCEESGSVFEVGGGFFGKLRWERAKGAMFAVGRPITPEAVTASWSKITGFEASTHPADITQSMTPILENLGRKSKGGNEFINVDEALGYEFPEAKTEYTERDVSLYALGVGAAHDPLDGKELPFVYELAGDGFKVLPTFAVIPAIDVYMKLIKEGKHAPGIHYGFDRVLHGEQFTEIKRPLPTNAKLSHKSKVKDIFDKGKNALVITATTTYDEQGNELMYNELTTFVRGAGGWGGDRGPSADINTPPDRAPDAVVEEKTADNQALLYRLTGDFNPLHADPVFAANFGFAKPILHGLCTFGFAGRHIVKAMMDGDPRRFKSIKVRFAESVFPGETIRTEIWKESDTRVVFRSKVVERNVIVISNAAVELYKEIPTQTFAKKEAPPETKPAAKTDASMSEMIMFGIGHHIETHPELVAKTSSIFQFRLKSPESNWLLDVKNGKGSCTRGTIDKADATFEMSDQDFVDMALGKADAQKLYFAGKLKIGGNVMAAQKLDFLKSIDREAAAKAYASRASDAATPAAASELAAPPKAARSPALFDALKDRIAKSPALVREIDAVLQFAVKSPDKSYVVDLKNGAGSVREGTEKSAAASFQIEEDDLVALAKGEALVKDLFMRGRLRVDGDVRFVHKLGFLKDLA